MDYRNFVETRQLPKTWEMAKKCVQEMEKMVVDAVRKIDSEKGRLDLVVRQIDAQDEILAGLDVKVRDAVARAIENAMTESGMAEIVEQAAAEAVRKYVRERLS